ncbi:MAG: flippase-like domain-containing protein [Actinomycetia bacterium]|nr:flippase-like domain-containing protein [Actinomycetes bacterium]
MKQGSIRGILVGVVFVAALVIIALRGESFFQFVDTLQTGAPLPLLAAVVVQMGKYIFQSVAYSTAFRTVEERLSAKVCFPLVFSAFFMNTIAPSLNTSGNLVFIDSARQRDIGPGRSTAACLLMQTSIESGFLVVMAIGFVIININGGITPLMLIAGAWVVILVGLMGGSLILAHYRPDHLSRILLPLEKITNGISQRFRKKPVNSWSTQAGEVLGEASAQIAKNPRMAARVFIFSVLASFFELACFCLCGMAFGVHNVAALFGGYVIAILFTMIAVTPMGLGVVETAVVLLLGTYGINTGMATAVTLSFRGIVFWLPFVIGLFCFRHTQGRSRKKENVE